jgi:hypothetical protein
MLERNNHHIKITFTSTAFFLPIEKRKKKWLIERRIRTIFRSICSLINWLFIDFSFFFVSKEIEWISKREKKEEVVSYFKGLWLLSNILWHHIWIRVYLFWLNKSFNSWWSSKTFNHKNIKIIFQNEKSV